MYQGVQCRAAGEPILYANNPAGMSRESRRRSLDALKALNEAEAAQFGDPETVTRIAQYELAYRMQMAVPEVMDIAKESPEMLAMYGAKPGEVPRDRSGKRRARPRSKTARAARIHARRLGRRVRPHADE